MTPFNFRGLEALQEINSSSRRSPFTQTALERILDSSLPAKYALTGVLKYDNIIDNGFYDTGRVNYHNIYIDNGFYDTGRVNYYSRGYVIGQKFVGQNFRRTKYFGGQNFRHQAKISTLLSDFCLTFVSKYWTKFSTDKMFRRTKFSTPS